MLCALGVVLDEAAESALWLEALVNCDLAPEAVPVTIFLQETGPEQG
jgi:hypothetical protein